jgi:MFS transporter, AAHS family, 4-hydroxybenzoate transporter
MSADVTDISELLDNRPLGRYQWMIFLLCAALVFIDGFDTQAIGYVAPALSHAWSLHPGALGPAFAAGLTGLMVGAFLLGQLADRIGRRRVLLACVAIFGVMTLLTAATGNLHELLLARFLAGIGLGGAMPNAIALTAEYCPEARRAKIVMMMFLGFPAGATVGGIVAARLLTTLGWQSVFLVGGGGALLLLLLLARILPESIRYLLLRDPRDPRIPVMVSRLGGTEYPPGKRFAVAVEQGKTASVAELFRHGRATTTLLIWIVFFMGLLDLFLLSSWLPTIIHDKGVSVSYAVVATSLFQFGSIIGSLLLSLLISRFGLYSAMAVSYLIGAIAIICIAVAGSHVDAIMFMAFLSGMTIIGCQNWNNGLASTFYPTAIRSTGVGYANAVGRIGSIVGPTVGGLMLSYGATPYSVFEFSTVPALCAAVAIGLLGRHKARMRAKGAGRAGVRALAPET